MMSNKTSVRLNIGAGKTHIPGFVNIDISDKADISLDISESPLPFDKDSVDLVFTYHTLEHIPNYLFALSEIYRVLKDRGVLLVGVPYVTLTEYNLVNPYHLHNFNEHSFAFFDPSHLKGSAEESNEIYFKKIFHRYHYIRIFNIVPPPLKRWCRRHLFNVVRKIDFGLIAIKSESSEPCNEYSKSDLQKKFNEIMTSRTQYETNKNFKPKNRIFRTAKRTWAWWQGY